MDRKQIMGLLIIFSLIFTYNYFFTPKPNVVDIKNEVSVINTMQDQSISNQGEEIIIPEEIYSLDSNNIQVQISSKGGSLSNVLVKNFSSDTDENNLNILDSQSSREKTVIKISDNVLIDLSKQDFCIEQSLDNLLVVTTNVKGQDNMKVSILYSIEEASYVVKKEVKVYKDDQEINYDSISVNWQNKLKVLEKDKNSCANKTTINYLTHKGDFESLKENSKNFQEKSIPESVKWITMKQRFFNSSVIFEDNEVKNVRVSIEPNDKIDNVSKFCTADYTVVGNSKKAKSIILKYYFGPNDFFKMKDVADQFYRNLPLGWTVVRWINMFVILPIFQIVKNWIPNVGLLILFVVLMLKIFLLPISYKSYISSLKMKILKPDLENIKNKYEDDLHKIQVEQMKLYRESGVNPLGGILLVLLQMPILLAVFNFIPSEIFFRGKSFLWATDMSTYDSILNLNFSIPFYGDHVSLFTILMTISTILHTVTNSEMNQNQQGNMKIMLYVLPVIFMFVLNNFPAALSLYYFVSNLITIIIQFIMKKMVNESKIKSDIDEKRVKFVHKPSFAERLQNITNAKN